MVMKTSLNSARPVISFGATDDYGVAQILFHLRVDRGGLLAGAYVGCFEMGFTFVLWLTAMKLVSATAKVANLIFLSPFLSLVLIALIFLGPLVYLAGMLGIGAVIAETGVQWGTEGAYVWSVDDGKAVRKPVRIIERREQLTCRVVVIAALDAERALSRCGEEVERLEERPAQRRNAYVALRLDLHVPPILWVGICTI